MSASCVVHAATLRGVQAVPVEVEVCVGNGMPGFSVVGMADASVQESRERVRAALRACGFDMPNSKVVVNLSGRGDKDLAIVRKALNLPESGDIC